ncbi:MFS transporter [Kocuria sp. cx-455]|nr:MFS transporter [Kocuria sp. cx-116]MBD2765820.1 MFS transporter [Kocuria sp. cx-455]
MYPEVPLSNSTTPQAQAPLSSQDSLAAAGGWPFLITAFIGRLPAATLQLGILLYVSGSGLSLGLAGITVAAVGLGSAVGAPLVGRFVDHFGPLPVVVSATVIQLLSLLALLLTVINHGPTTLILVCAALVGSANPQVGAIARAHWSGLARRRRQPRLISRALGYETACDETSFILGPVVAGLLVGLLGPNPALLTLMAWVLVGQGAFIVYLVRHRTEHGAAMVEDTAAGGIGGISIAKAVPPMIVCLCVGTVFGSTQTALTAVSALRGTEAYTGVIYGFMGAGSAVASILVSRLPERFPLSLRVAIGASIIAVACAGLLSLPSAPLFAGLFAIMGVGVGTMLVSSFGRGERIAPSHRIASVMTMLTTCLVLGVSLGAALGGVLSVQPGRGFLLTMAAAVVALFASIALHVTKPGRPATHQE